MTLGQTIHRLRLEHGLSQADLADRLEVSWQSISKWETDSSVPELDKLIALSRIFGVTLDELVGHTPDMPASPAPEAASDSTPDPAKSAPTTLPLRKLMGILLLFFGGTVFLFFALPGRSLANGLVYCAPLAVSGVLCLACRRPGLWCAWIWLFYGCFYLRFASGVLSTLMFHWTLPFRTATALSSGSPSWIFWMAIAWAFVLLAGLLLALTVRRFRHGVFRFTRRTVPTLAAEWALFLALPFLADQISLALLPLIQGDPVGRMYTYLDLLHELLMTALDFSRLALLAILLVCLIRGIRTHCLRKKAGLL